MSLSTWFRDYLYIPLGGSRMGAGRTAANLLTVFLLCGLWHGASWNFVLWGAFHGSFLALERRLPIHRLPAVLGWLYTLLVVNTGFVLFRAADLGTAATLFRGMLGFGTHPSGGVESLPAAWWALVLGFLVVHAVARRTNPADAAAKAPGWAFAPAYGIAWALALPWVAVGYTPFIYFQF